MSVRFFSLIALLLLLSVEIACADTIHHGNTRKRKGVKGCSFDINLEWVTHVGSSIVATPRIVDLLTNGLKDILIPTYSQYFEALSGLDGNEVVGFPFIHPNMKSYSSPLPIDIDGDGTVDWLVGLYSGELLLLGENGEPRGVIQIPPLAIKKDWMHKSIPAENAAHMRASKPMYDEEMMREVLRARTIRDLRLHTRHQNFSKRTTGIDRTKFTKRENRIKPTSHSDTDHSEQHTNNNVGKKRFSTRRNNEKREQSSREARLSMSLFSDSELFSSMNSADEDFSLRQLRGPIFTEVADDEVEVDAHILSTPIITDIDNNGDVDIIVHTSFFFDPDDYSDKNPLPEGIKTEDYAATALLCFNLVTGELRWTRVLHVTTAEDMHPAYALSSPLVLNADSDASLEIYVTSTTGSIHAFNSSGDLLEGWPVHLGPMTSTPVAEDLSGTGLYHICAGDATGVVACFSPNGSILWETIVEGALSDRITFGDIDGDGKTDVIFGTTSGHIYALHGINGTVKKNFPIKTDGPIISPPLLLNVQRSYEDKLHIVVPSHDGYLYVVDGKGDCLEAIDIDEKSSTMVLADDLTGNGQMDLLVTTLQGGVFVFETQAQYHPLKRWPSKTKGINGATASENGIGVFITAPFRTPRDIRGATFQLEINIQDPFSHPQNHYTIDIFIGPRIQVFHGVFNKPGKRLLRVRTPLQRMYGNVIVIMTTSSGQTYTDEVSLSFNMHYLESVKFTLLFPFFIVCLTLIVIKAHHKVDKSKHPII